jgi:hypothetical protein
MRKIFNHDLLENSFLETGYVRVPMLSESQVASILSEIGKMRPDDNFAPDGLGVVKCSYHCTFLDTNIDYKRQVYKLLQEVFTPLVDKYLAGYQLLSCNFYVKPAGTGEFSIHQNWPSISNLNDTTVTIWCPLIDVIESNGAIQVVEGSHKILPHIFTPGVAAYFGDFEQSLIDKYLKPIPMSAGDAIIFDDSLIHWSGRNDSLQPRIAIQLLCTPIAATDTFFYPESESRFEMIRTDVDFYIETSMMQLMQHQPDWQSLGFVENQNRPITEEEFVELLKNGAEIRSKVYAKSSQ